MTKQAELPTTPHKCEGCGGDAFYEGVLCRDCADAEDESRKAWVQFAAAAMQDADSDWSLKARAIFADGMLVQYHKRWPKGAK